MLQKMLGCSLINCIISTRYNVNLTFQRVPVDNFKVSVEENKNGSVCICSGHFE